MRAHCGSATLQEDGCAVLRIVAGSSEDRSVAVASAGGIEAVVRAMGDHKGSTGVQKYGCGALRNLAAGSEDIRAAVATVGGIEAVVNAMQSHIEAQAHALAELAPC